MLRMLVGRSIRARIWSVGYGSEHLAARICEMSLMTKGEFAIVEWKSWGWELKNGMGWTYTMVSWFYSGTNIQEILMRRAQRTRASAVINWEERGKISPNFLTWPSVRSCWGLMSQCDNLETGNGPRKTATNAGSDSSCIPLVGGSIGPTLSITSWPVQPVSCESLY